MVARELQQLSETMAYAAASAAKIGWYTAQYVGSRHLSGPVTRPGDVPKSYRGATNLEGALQQSFLSLFAAEARDISAGVYRLPKGFRRPPSPIRLWRQAQENLRQARTIATRRFTPKGGVEVRQQGQDHLPTYYRQNFHFQSGGWLSDASADIYDTQVEALFTGAGAAMRRRVLPMLRDELNRIDASADELPMLADIGTGTGVVLRDIQDNFPELGLFGVDLSEPYLQHARKRLPRAKNVTFLNAPAEQLPFADRSLPMAMSVYLFHELPPAIRRSVASEIARVIRPGGAYFHLETIQYQDTPFDALLEGFPRLVHEPYYDSYCREDLGALFSEVGLYPEERRLAFSPRLPASGAHNSNRLEWS